MVREPKAFGLFHYKAFKSSSDYNYHYLLLTYTITFSFKHALFLLAMGARFSTKSISTRSHLSHASLSSLMYCSSYFPLYCLSWALDARPYCFNGQLLQFEIIFFIFFFLSSCCLVQNINLL